MGVEVEVLEEGLLNRDGTWLPNTELEAAVVADGRSEVGPPKIAVVPVAVPVGVGLVATKADVFDEDETEGLPPKRDDPAPATVFPNKAVTLVALLVEGTEPPNKLARTVVGFRNGFERSSPGDDIA